MAKKDTKKAYQKPEVRRIKLSLAELTLGSNCHGAGDGQAGGCEAPNIICNQ
jgi:hypothetical protein